MPKQQPTWNDENFYQLAFLVRAKAFGPPAEGRDHWQSLVKQCERAVGSTLRRLEEMADRPETWSHLPNLELSLLTYQQLIHYSCTAEETEIRRLTHLYRLLIGQVGSGARNRLARYVAEVLDSDAGQLNALFPFIYHDPDPIVVSSAALSYATIAPLTDDDPMSGARLLRDLAETHGDGDDAMQAGIVMGILQLGDRRTLDILEGCWEVLSHDGQRLLTQQIRPQHIDASVVEFYLRWMEAVDEDDFGFPAGALGRLPVALPNERVRDVVRAFPAPYNLPDEAYRDNPPIRVVQEWSIPEFARIIEPRLRMLFLRETYDKVMPRVLDAWGLEVGLDTEADQQARLIAKAAQDVATMKHLADDVVEGESGLSTDERARKAIANQFSMSSPPAAMAMLLAVGEAFPGFAANRRRDASTAQDPRDRDTFIGQGDGLEAQAQAITRLLRQHFGPDLEAAAVELARAWMLVNGGEELFR